MKNEPKYRHEYKYIITQQQIENLKVRLTGVLELDSHVNLDGDYAGFYNIRSLYFDDISNRCYYENENGIDPREKFRIRIYNHNDARISLELKQKVCGKCNKIACLISKEQCIDIINGTYVFCEDDHYLLKKLYYEMKTRSLRPYVIVEYDRIPYVSKLGNTRVTIDTNIRSSNRIEDFFVSDIPMRLINSNSCHVLEVKWDEYIPEYIVNSLSLSNLKWTPFSKYYLCRKFSLGNNSGLFKF